MLLPDLLSIFQWWTIIFFIGAIFIPITNLIFPNFFDKGYIFAKVIGIALTSYVVFILGFLKILPFETQNIFLIVGIFILINLFILKKIPSSNIKFKSMLPIFVIEEFIFILIFLLWSFIHAHQPEIHGLEKYMDYGFINSVLRTEYLPPKDMWLTPFSINYYYFGHLITAILTKLSLLPSSITFNLMLSTIAALSFVSAFSIGANLIYQFKIQNSKFKIASQKLIALVGGFVTAFILNFTGNLHAIYLFFKPYQNENPVPFWQLVFSPLTFPNGYWYPNATRFIENTIHEFPLYSYVVSDLHGHVLDIPFVLLTIAVLLSLVLKNNNQALIQNSKLKMQNYNVKLRGNNVALRNSKFKILEFIPKLFTFNFSLLTLLAFLLAIMYMTNAWDGIIYFVLSFFVICYIFLRSNINFQGIQNSKFRIQNYILKFKTIIPSLVINILILGAGFIIFTTPFNFNFKPFASEIGVLCAPKFLTDIGNFGPFIFETDHCQHSPWWQLFILYGFFYFWVISFIFFIFNKHNSVISSRFSVFGFKLIGQSVSLSDKLRTGKQIPDNRQLKTDNRLLSSDIFVLILILFSTLLIIIPEFVYVKDIYPAHYRANTMFKLVYQSFIILSLSSGYIIIRILNIKYQILKIQIKNKIFNFYYVYLLFAILFFILVFLYPYFAVNSYFGNLKKYSGLDGIKYLKPLYSTDYDAILWINKNIKGQPVILEAQGDSYTDYGRVSTNTGLPTVLGWVVHEWLWRGSYDIPSPRIEEVQKMYESKDVVAIKQLLKKYNVSLIFIGELEKQKYPNLYEGKFKTLGKIIYQKGDTKIFRIHY